MVKEIRIRVKGIGAKGIGVKGIGVKWREVDINATIHRMITNRLLHCLRLRRSE
jgi:hypothetical protein